ncbi:hypothetical protein [Colwellia psychrerythraea]|uniref:Uncharacterized protein n=1 Tax=Colwellia psychrerythraea TaxID=28229 RepID=A0A099KH80_COLPS|nr:hypothetical protein [Colwellia psychrerythraea]KGJ89696.1 hypothetical protein GAB14E_3857 [Colwellia psychrerythraea]
MSKVIQVLETMASDASLINEENISTFLTTTEINAEQQRAITAKSAGQLAETIADLPELMAFSQVLPADEDAPIEDEQEDDNSASSKLLASSF